MRNVPRMGQDIAGTNRLSRRGKAGQNWTLKTGVTEMTARTAPTTDAVLERARVLVMEQAGDLIEKGHLSPGETAELYVGAGIEVALAACPREEVLQLMQRLTDEIESRRDLN